MKCLPQKPEIITMLDGNPFILNSNDFIPTDRRQD